MKRTLCCLSLVALCAAATFSAARIEKPRQHYILSIVSDPMPGKEAAFNRWYDEVHIPDVLRLMSEIKSAERYVLTDRSAGAASSRYLAIYDIETNDLAAFRRTVGVVSKQIGLGDALDPASMKWTYHRRLTRAIATE